MAYSELIKNFNKIRAWEIIEQIGPTAEIREHIKPVYNFKAAE